MDENLLAEGNCNKAKCKTCIFGETPVELSEFRQIEIIKYLSNFEAVHICHTTNKVCYGALEFQARVLFARGLLPNDQVETMLTEARKQLNL